MGEQHVGGHWQPLGFFSKPLQVGAEMADAAMGCQEFPVKWDPLRLFTLEGFGEETEWLPMPPDVLLQHATAGDDGCVDGECQGGAVHWVYEHGSVGKGLLRFLEGVLAGVRPLKLFGLPTKDLVEWAEDGCDVGDEAAVVVEGAEVPLELLDGGGSRDLADGVDLLRKRCDSLGADVVIEELERGSAEDAFGTVDHESVGLH